MELNSFIKLVNERKIQEIECFKNMKYYMIDGQNYFTDTSIAPKSEIFNLFKHSKNLRLYSTASVSEFQKLFTIATGVFSTYYMYRITSPNQKFENNQLVEPNNITFKDVFGLDKEKEELLQVIDFLQNQDKYNQIGARLKRGILLYGPPGTGKTLLAKATATESKCNFISVSSTEFVEKYVGVGPQRVRELFKNARNQQPCIIFIDEIDGMASKRESKLSGIQESCQERISTLNQLLMEMDGFNQKTNIVVIGATNREQVLDDALMRSGRFDIKIQLKLPNENQRFGILNLHLNAKKHLVNKKTIGFIAKDCVNYSGADLENVVNESAYCCIRKNRVEILDQDLLDSYLKINQTLNINQ